MVGVYINIILFNKNNSEKLIVIFMNTTNWELSSVYIEDREPYMHIVSNMSLGLFERDRLII